MLGSIKGFEDLLKLKGYSSETIKPYLGIMSAFIESNKTVKEFLLEKSSKSRSTLRTTYFALQIYHKEYLKESFKEKTPLAKKN